MHGVCQDQLSDSRRANRRATDLALNIGFPPPLNIKCRLAFSKKSPMGLAHQIPLHFKRIYMCKYLNQH